MIERICTCAAWEAFMKIKNKIAVVTGGADGIGKGLCERFAKEGATKVIVLDRNGDGARKTAAAIGGVAYDCDVSREVDIKDIVDEVEKTIGPITLFCSNAGIGDFGGRPDDATSQPNEQWQRGWEVNVMAHVYAARACLPYMIARREGYFVNTASAAGLLNQIGNPVYGVTKHAAVGYAEILAITHRDQGIRVSVLCPQAVDTPMLRRAGVGSQNVDGILTAEQVAQCVVEAIDEERFEILPHPQVLGYMQKKTENYSRWIGGMAKLRRALADAKNERDP
jgi:NAD(P)-dependent dehydrogenase (short-subunit alcohol dehydrogenase family)